MIAEDTRIFLILQQSKLNRFLKIFKDRDWPKIFVFSVFLAIAFILSVTTYFFTRTAFFFLRFHLEFLESMVFYILLAWFFLIFFLTLCSSLITALEVFFTQDDDDFLLSCPIRSQIIFESRLVNLLVLSSWPTIVFGFPLLLAFQKSFNLGFLHFILSFLALILILLISSLIASILTLKMVSFTGRVGREIVSVLVLFGFPLLVWWVSTVLVPPDLIETFEKLELDQINQFLKSLPISSNLFPSTWAVNFIMYWSTQPQLVLSNLIKLFILLIALAAIVYWLVNREYFLDLAEARVGFFIAGSQDVVKQRAKKSFPSFLRGIKGAFLEKDVLIFLRNQAEIFQGGFILSLVLLYFLILGKVPLDRLEERLSHFSIDNLIEMNFIFGAYILAVFALRFIFPSMSREGQSGWLVWSAPFKKSELFGQKFLTGWGFLSLIGGIVSFLSTLMLKFGFQFFLAQLIIYFVLSLGLTAINLGLGAFSPDFREKNLEKISTSPSGIFATAFSLFYILIVSAFLFPKPGVQAIFSLAYLSIFIIAVILTMVFSIISLSKIEKYQF